MRGFLSIKKVILPLITIAVIFFLIPLIVRAQPLVQCGPYPLRACELCDLFEMIGRIYALATAVIIALIILFVMYGGFTYLTSLGDPQRLKSAMEILKGAGIGLFVFVFAFVIISQIYIAVGANPPATRTDIWDICPLE